MPSLKEQRVRIASVKSTQKITSAMKMVAAAKLRRAQEAAAAGRPYAEKMAAMLQAVLASGYQPEEALPLLQGTGKNDTYLLIIVSTDKGLCGGFNTAIFRAARLRMKHLGAQGKTVKIVTIGKKARDVFVRETGKRVVKSYADITRKKVDYDLVAGISEDLQQLLSEGAFDVAEVLYNKFRSAMLQVPTWQQVIPMPSIEDGVPESGLPTPVKSQYEFEPDAARLLAKLLPKNLSVQLFSVLLDSVASEHGARMSAMDNATRNAGDMIRRLTLSYNRARQAMITKELIEIISGAEAV
ncbi:MAG: F0F1 ATP synthase subunit gamma [Thalassospira sp.]|nr:F0F1 ATP synthase subunit gamma [Thalassospira sp.]